MSKYEIGDLVSHHDGRGVGMVMGVRKDTSNLTVGKCIKIKVKWFETPIHLYQALVLPRIFATLKQNGHFLSEKVTNKT